MEIANIAHLATAVSAVVAAGSVLSGFILYRLSRRDQRLKEIREGMVMASAVANQLDRSLSFEIAYEIVTETASSVILEPFLKNLHETYFNCERDKKDELNEYLEKNTPVIYGSVSSARTTAFENGLIAIDSEASKIEFDFPGVARALYASSNILRNAYHVQKRLVFSEDAWKAAIKQCYEDQEIDLTRYDFFLSELAQLFVGTVLGSLKRTGQDTINDTLKSMEIVVRNYLEKDPNELLKASKFQKSVKLTPVSEAESVAENLRELERSMGDTLPSDDLLQLRQYSAQIDTRETA